MQINCFPPPAFCAKIPRASAISPRPRRQRQDIPLPRRNPRRAARANPDGPPLILLAPKQATFQLERQLLAGGEISGYTRLQIFSFDRLARFVLKNSASRRRSCLSDEGRIMVLRALLMRHEGELKFLAAARGVPASPRN
jgi:hypothetical protein